MVGSRTSLHGLPSNRTGSRNLRTVCNLPVWLCLEGGSCILRCMFPLVFLLFVYLAGSRTWVAGVQNNRIPFPSRHMQQVLHPLPHPAGDRSNRSCTGWLHLQPGLQGDGNSRGIHSHSGHTDDPGRYNAYTPHSLHGKPGGRHNHRCREQRAAVARSSLCDNNKGVGPPNTHTGSSVPGTDPVLQIRRLKATGTCTI